MTTPNELERTPQLAARQHRREFVEAWAPPDKRETFADAVAGLLADEYSEMAVELDQARAQLQTMTAERDDFERVCQQRGEKWARSRDRIRELEAELSIANHLPAAQHEALRNALAWAGVHCERDCDFAVYLDRLTVELSGARAQLGQLHKRLPDILSAFKTAYQLWKNDPTAAYPNPETFAAEYLSEWQATLSATVTVEPGDGWISVDQQLPPERVDVLGYSEDFYDVCWLHGGVWVRRGGVCLPRAYWRPLPPPPTTPAARLFGAIPAEPGEPESVEPKPDYRPDWCP